MEFFPQYKTKFFVAAPKKDQLNFIATKPKSPDSSFPAT